MSIAKFAEYADYIVTIIFAFEAILFFTAALILAIVWVSSLLQERFNKERKKKLFLKRFYKQLKALHDEAVQDAEEFDGEAPEEPCEKDDKKWYVYGKTFDEIHGSVEESNVKRGPFDTCDEAEFYRDVLDEERTISGQHLYYDLYVDKEEAVEETLDNGDENEV